MIRYGLYLSDLQRGSTDSHGIINYALGLAGALPAVLRKDERLVVYANREVAHELPMATSPVAQLQVHEPPHGVAGRLWSDHIASVARALEDQVDLLHFPKGHLPFLRRERMRLVATIHDDIPIRYAEARYDQWRGAKARYFAWATRHALRTADLILTVSEFSRRRLVELSKDSAIPIAVSHEGITLPDQPFVPLAQRDAVLLHLGSRFPHKRTREAVEMVRRFLEEGGGGYRGLKLVVTGNPGSDFESCLTSAEVDRIPNTLSNAELASLMARSRALLFTSEYEGFGLPPVEAYSLGTPAVYALAGAVPEVMAGAPGGYRPGDYGDFRRALEEVLWLNEEQLRSLKREFRVRYSWHTVAERTVVAYRVLLSSSPGY